MAIPFWHLASCSRHEALRMRQVDQSWVLFEHQKASASNAASGISSLPRPCCESMRQQHLNNSKQHGFGKGWQHALGSMRGWRPSISTGVPRDPADPLDLQKHCCLLNLCQFWQRSLQQSYFWGCKPHVFSARATIDATVMTRIF